MFIPRCTVDFTSFYRATVFYTKPLISAAKFLVIILVMASFLLESYGLGASAR
jgi:hypothetical protein